MSDLAELLAAIDVALDRALEADLTPGDHRTFEAAVQLVLRAGTLAVRVYVGEVAELARLSHRQTRRNLVKLNERGVVEWTPRRGTDRVGVGLRSTLGLPAASKADTRRVRLAMRANRASLATGLTGKANGTPLVSEDVSLGESQDPSLTESGVVGGEASRARAREAADQLPLAGVPTSQWRGPEWH